MRACPYKVKEDGEYPSIKGIVKNPYYANILLESFGGCTSETTAIFQYIYQSYIGAPSDECFSITLENIAIVEMRHHDLLGSMIVELGVCPCITNSKNQFWDARNVNYTNDIRKILNSNIESEKKAIAGYEKSIQLINDNIICDILRRIIKDEIVHIQVFKELLTKMCC